MSDNKNWWSVIERLHSPGGSNPIKDYAEESLSWHALSNNTKMYLATPGGTINNLAEVIAQIDAFQPGRAVVNRIDKNKEKSRASFWAWDDGAINITSYDSGEDDDECDIHVWVMCADENICQKIVSIIANNIVPAEGRTADKVFVIGMSNSAYDFYKLGIASIPLERDNYTSKVIGAYDEAVADLRTTAPRGRLTIFDGPPGSGKTHLIRAFINDIKNGIFVFVPPSIVDFLSSPELLPMLIKKKSSSQIEGPIVFIFEDADNILTARTKDNLSVISTLLNMTSGLLGSMLDIRASATTNSPTGDIDPALLRPGRLSVHSTVGNLNSHEATKVYKRLTGATRIKIVPEPKQGPTYKEAISKDSISLAEVYRLARDNGWQPPVENQRKKSRHTLADFEE